MRTSKRLLATFLGTSRMLQGMGRLLLSLPGHLQRLIHLRKTGLPIEEQPKRRFACPVG